MKTVWTLSLVVWMLPAIAQSQIDSLTDDDIVSIKTDADRSFFDYYRIMNELADPKIPKFYRDSVIAESKDFFTENARIQVDYDTAYLPPNLPYEVSVEKYLGDFNAYYQNNDIQNRLQLYYTNRYTSDIEWDEEDDFYYLTISYTSVYGDIMPQERVATLRADKVDGEWETFITYIKFENAPEEDVRLDARLEVPPKEVPQKVARLEKLPHEVVPVEAPPEEALREVVRQAAPVEVLVQEVANDSAWLTLARQAADSIRRQRFDQAWPLLQQSIALDSTAYNLRLLGYYYESEERWEQALAAYQKSEELGRRQDTSYQDARTAAAIRRVSQQFDQQQEAAHPLPDTSSNEPVRQPVRQTRIDLNQLATGGRRGKEYTIDWQLPEENPVSVLLLQEGKPAQPVRRAYEASSLDWKINLDTKPGTYQLRVLDEQGWASVTSAPFRISPRFPLGLKIGVSAGVLAGYMILAKSQGIFPFSSNIEDPPPPDGSEVKDLPTPEPYKRPGS